MNYLIREELQPEDRQKLQKYSDLLAHLMFYRGVSDVELAENFLDTHYENHSHDPALLKDIEIAVERILSAIENNERICVFSDYDADGIPGAVILTDFFKKIGYENYFVYIPHRNIEGFGLNDSAVDKIIEDGAKVLITIDCGISDVKQIARASDAGIDVIITDHHDPNGHVSGAIAVINPKQADCTYPDKNLCGSGVIFKVVQALIAEIRVRAENSAQENNEVENFWQKIKIQEGWEKWLLDMVGIATLSDMVPLVGENRVFAKYGLFVMQKSPRKGFQKLLRKNRINQNKINEEDVGFTISPRINAASRMDSPEIAFQMLSTADEVEADRLVSHLDKINNERKGHVAAIVREIHKKVKEREKDIEKSDNNDGKNESGSSEKCGSFGEVIVFGNPKWQPSLCGLVASKLVDEFNKPAFVWGRGESQSIKGSCRSDGSLNLVELMNNVNDGIIFQYGGHEMAGGFEVTDEGVFDLEKALLEAYQKTKMTDGFIGSQIIVDKKISIDEIDRKLFDELNKLAPFGVGNEKPVFLIEGAEIAEVSFFGKENNHLKILFRQNNTSSNGGRKISAIKFFVKHDDEFLSKLKVGDKINVIFNIEDSNFAGYNELRMRILEVFE